MTNRDFVSMVRLCLVWSDPHMDEVEVQVRHDGWSAHSRHYTSLSELGNHGAKLRKWCESVDGSLTVPIAGEIINSEASLQFFITDGSGHISCRVALNPNPFGLGERRIALDVPTETGLVDRFAAELQALAIKREGYATLEGTLG